MPQKHLPLGGMEIQLYSRLRLIMPVLPLLQIMTMSAHLSMQWQRGDIQPLRFYYGAQLKRVVITITGLLLGIKMKIYCCLNTVGFFMDGCGVIPPDSKEITAEHWQSLLKSQAEGGVIDFSVFPPSIKEVIRTHDDEVADANFQKQMLISDATDFINSRQWQGKAALGRLKEDELKQYNLWLDYLDALELIDTSGAPDIEWPTSPAVQAR